MGKLLAPDMCPIFPVPLLRDISQLRVQLGH